MTGGQRTLRRIEADGSGERVILSNGTYGQSFFGLSGGGVLYSSFGKSTGGHVYLLDSEGGSPRQVASLPGGEWVMDVSLDERAILLKPRQRRNELWTISPRGGEPTLITDSADSLGGAGFSYDGTRVLYSSLQEIDGVPRREWKVVSSQGGDTLATLALPSDASNLVWTLDGKSVTFLRTVNGATNVFKQRIEGGDPEAVTRFPDGETLQHALSPDGRRILLLRRQTDHENLWMTSADGSDPVPLTRFETGGISSMEWMLPQGQAVLFTYGQDGSDVVLIRRTDDLGGKP